ncbi:tripartite tricarboxylate transporter TctB family protein [Clostridiaceae bacterium 35-E11]
MKKNIDIVASLTFLALGSGILFLSSSMNAVIENDVGPSFMPKLVGIGFVILSVFKLFFALKMNEEKKDTPKLVLGKGLLTILIFGVYVLSFKSLGFVISSILYLLAEITLLKWEGGNITKGLKSTIIISVIVPVVVYFFFTGVLDLVLPAGMLG